MKTPMQLLYEQLERTVIQQKSMMSIGEYESFKAGMEMAIAIIEQDGHFEKEKDVMCEFAFNCGDEIKDQNNWRSPRNLTNYEVILDFYNETFNTKEK